MLLKVEKLLFFTSWLLLGYTLRANIANHIESLAQFITSKLFSRSVPPCRNYFFAKEISSQIWRQERSLQRQRVSSKRLGLGEWSQTRVSRRVFWVKVFFLFNPSPKSKGLVLEQTALQLIMEIHGANKTLKQLAHFQAFVAGCPRRGGGQECQLLRKTSKRLAGYRRRNHLDNAPHKSAIQSAVEGDWTQLVIWVWVVRGFFGLR